MIKIKPGAAQCHGANNVLTKIKKSMEPKYTWNQLKYIHNYLYIRKIEDAIAKIYKCFYLYNVRVTVISNNFSFL